MTGIADWLASIGLGEYVERFRENAIDLSVVRDLTEQDLKDLGVLLGHRRKMLRAIVELQGEVPRTPRRGTKPAPADNAGRRQLTVMFCDLVGSSALSARLDLEDLRAVMGSYHGCVAEVVARNEGVIARYMGDGVLAYSAIPRRTRMMPNRRHAPDWRWSMRSPGFGQTPLPSCGFALASLPAWWWWAI